MKINWKAVPDAMRFLGKFGEKHLPTILTSAGIVGFIGTAVLAAKEAPKAETAIRKAEREKTIAVRGEIDYANEVVKLNPWEKVKVTSGYYWPSFALGTASTICILSAHKIDLTRLASVTAAYQLSKKDLKELKDKIVQTDGEDKLREYEKSTHRDIMMSGPPTDIYNTGHGTTVFFDPTTGRPFYSDLWYVEKALRTMVRTCKDESTYSLAELRSDLDLPRNDTEDNFQFTYETIRDIDENNIGKFLFEYHDVDLDKGDARPCIWLKISDRLHNRYDYEDETSFRYR